METPTQRSGTISPPVFYSSAILIAILVLFASISFFYLAKNLL